MADLQVCYFCGSGPDDDIGEYAVVPPALEPDEQQSVALCPDCREKLTSVMDPVVDAAEAYARENAGAGAGADAGGGGARGDGDTAPGSRAGEPTAGPHEGRGGERGDAGASGTDAGRGDAGVAPDDAVEPSSPGGAGADADDGVTVDPADAGDSMGGGAGDGGDSGGGAGGGGDSGSGADDAPAESSAVRDQPHADDELVGRNNEAYNKTLRLLQNREFPVERHEIEQVAASAYQLDPQEVSDAIDALIRKGLLTQEGAQLVRS